jgi:ATP-dependent DNA helicase RecQ
VKGFGKKKAETFGDEILEIIKDYCTDHNIEINVMDEKPEKAKKPAKPAKKEKEDTRKISYDLFMQGKTIEEIAIERGYTSNTIEGHLALYVQQGKLNINQLVSPEKISLISDFFLKSGSAMLSPAKEALGDSVSYGELKLVLAHLHVIAHG